MSDREEQDLGTYLALAEAAAEGDAGAAVAPVAFWLARRIEFDENALRAALRRAMLVVAAGGDPHRDLELEDAAVQRLAAELDDAPRRAELERGLGEVGHAAASLGAVSAAAAVLQNDLELAWRWVALTLIAEELTEEPVP